MLTLDTQTGELARAVIDACKSRGLRLVTAESLTAGLIAGALWLPGLSDVLRLPSPGGQGLAVAAGFSAVTLIGGQIVLWLVPPEPALKRAKA